MFSKNSFRFILLSSLLLVNYSVKDNRQPIVKKAIVNCVDIPDPMLFSTVSICGSKIDTYEIPPKIEHLYGVSDFDSYLKNVDWIYRNSKNRIVTKDSKKKLSYYDVFLPRKMVNGSSYKYYAVGIFSALSDVSGQILFDAYDSIDYNHTIITTTGDSTTTEFTASFNASLGGFLSSFSVNLGGGTSSANAFYVENSTSVSVNGHYVRPSDAPSDSWRIEKYGDYYPIKIEKIKMCPEYVDPDTDAPKKIYCNDRKHDSYVSDVIYKLVPLSEYEVIQSFMTTESEPQRGYEYKSSVKSNGSKYLSHESIESIRQFPHFRFDKYL